MATRHISDSHTITFIAYVYCTILALTIEAHTVCGKNVLGNWSILCIKETRIHE